MIADKRRQPNWICMWIGAGISFTSVASVGPDTGRLPGKQCGDNSESVLPPFKGPRYGREVAKFRERLPVLNRFGVECRGRDSAKPRGVQGRTLAASDAMTRIGGARRAEFCRSQFGFSLGRKPKERARKGTESERGQWAERCYQTCYHFLEKAARNRMNQGPSVWVMSLK